MRRCPIDGTITLVLRTLLGLFSCFAKADGLADRDRVPEWTRMGLARLLRELLARGNALQQHRGGTALALRQEIGPSGKRTQLEPFARRSQENEAFRHG